MAEDNPQANAQRAEPTTERDTAAGSARRGTTAPSVAEGAGSAANSTAQNPSRRVTSRELEQYIISSKPSGILPPMVAPIAPQSLEEALRTDSRVQYVRTVRLQAGLSSLAADPFAPHDLHVVRMSPETAVDVSQRVGSLAYVERDEFLRISPETVVAGAVASPGLGAAALAGTTLRLTLTVVGKNNAPLANAQIVVFGSQSSTQGVTDQTGRAALTLPGETVDTIRGITVTPKADYWSTWIPSPLLDGGDNLTVALVPLDQAFPGSSFPGFPGFPSRGITAWGLTATNVDQLQPALHGQGITIGVIDTGIAARTHQDLRGQVDGGYNIIAQNPDAWDRDDEGHGTHCAGVIGALNSGRGVRGIAPGVKLRSYTVFPGGRFSDLIDALNHCIQDNVDIVNLSLSTDTASDLVEQKILQAKQQGIACIVAAGNAGGPVQFPACSPNVLAVAAVGKQGTFPPGTWQTIQPVTTDGLATTSDGYFSPAFTCFGPGVSICAPGVAVVSCFPPNDYAVMDGTSIAAPHVTGIAALVLAHHPDFQGPYRERNARRVDRLFEILMQGARPLALGSPSVSVPRTGAGLADAVRALSVPPTPSLPGGGAPSPILKPQTWADVMRSLASDSSHAGQAMGSIGSASVTQTSSSVERESGPQDTAEMLSAVAAVVARSVFTR